MMTNSVQCIFTVGPYRCVYTTEDENVKEGSTSNVGNVSILFIHSSWTIHDP